MLKDLADFPQLIETLINSLVTQGGRQAKPDQPLRHRRRFQKHHLRARCCPQ
jgi:hypothetical protein